MSEEKGLEEGQLVSALRSFYAALFSIGSFLVPQADRLLQSSLRRSCREAVALAISQSYTQLYDTLRREDEDLGYSPQVKALLQHTPEHIDLVLELQSPAKRGGGGGGG